MTVARSELAVALAVALVFTLALSGTPAQGQARSPATAQAPPAPKAPAAAEAAPLQQPSQKVAMPDPDKIVLLVRTTLLTLNDAIQTGNYTVLRDLAAPGFRESNTAGRLSQIFANLTQRGIDLTIVAIMLPQISEPPSIDARNSLLRIKGFFPGQPVRVDFEVLYQPVGGRWRVFGLAVSPASAGPAPASQPSGPQPESAQGADKQPAPKTNTAPLVKKNEPTKK